MTHPPLSIHDFDYELPAELIARYPAPERTQSRLLCLDKDTGQIAHHSFSAILSFIQPGDLLILNNFKQYQSHSGTFVCPEEYRGQSRDFD